MNHHIEDLKEIFDSTFKSKYSTILSFGHNEPFYKARTSLADFSIIQSREDFFASALHEIAHWCIAGKERRNKDDYGYWYSPDGRCLDKQKEFESVEVKPQAIEKEFSHACGHIFKPSIDNLALPNYDASNFMHRINQQHAAYLENGFPLRAQLFISKLKDFYLNS